MVVWLGWCAGGCVLMRERACRLSVLTMGCRMGGVTEEERAAQLDEDYERLGLLLLEASPRDAAGIARERRLNRAERATLGVVEGVTLVDELAEKRGTSAKSGRVPRGA